MARCIHQRLACNLIQLTAYDRVVCSERAGRAQRKGRLGKRIHLLKQGPDSRAKILKVVRKHSIRIESPCFLLRLPQQSRPESEPRLHSGGWGYRCSLKDAQAESDRHGTFERMGLRYVQAQLVPSMQSAGCNAEHNVEQRLARWLLLCADRVGGLQFKMSQEFLSHMLGTTRPYVTVAAYPLKKEGLIT
jgi:CRP-like cAMP-binding protein